MNCKMGRHFDQNKAIEELANGNRCLNTLKRKVVQDKFTVSQARFESEELYHLSFEEVGHWEIIN